MSENVFFCLYFCWIQNAKFTGFFFSFRTLKMSFDIFWFAFSSNARNLGSPPSHIPPIHNMSFCSLTAFKSFSLSLVSTPWLWYATYDILYVCFSAWDSWNVLDRWVYSFFQFGNFNAIISSASPSFQYCPTSHWSFVHVFIYLFSVHLFLVSLALCASVWIAFIAVSFKYTHFVFVYYAIFLKPIWYIFSFTISCFSALEVPFGLPLWFPFLLIMLMSSFKFFGMSVIALLAFSSVILGFFFSMIDFSPGYKSHFRASVDI